MIYSLKKVKGIAYFLSMLIVFQSCVIYNQTPSSVAEASQYDKRLMKVKTIYGDEYKLNWIEKKNGNIISIKNAEREFLDRKDVIQIVLSNSKPRIISLDSALMNPGTLQVVIKDDKGNFNSIEYIRISDRQDLITAYKMTRKDTLTVVIPINQIEQIQLQDKGTSGLLTALTSIGILTMVIGAIAMIDSGGFTVPVSTQ